MEYVSADKTKDLTPVGFYVNKHVYIEYQKMAAELFEQIVPYGNSALFSKNLM